MSKSEVLRKLGVSPNHTQKRKDLNNYIEQNSIDISHFTRRTNIQGRWSNITLVKKNAKQSDSVGTFLELMGLTPIGHNYQTAKKYLLEYKINTTHFKKAKNPYRTGKRTVISLQEVLKGNHPKYSTYWLKQRLLSEKILEEICAECNIDPVWNNKQLVLHLDHQNGIHTDHRLENLRMLCPNCHSQTATYCGRNKPKSKV